MFWSSGVATLLKPASSWGRPTALWRLAFAQRRLWYPGTRAITCVTSGVEMAWSESLRPSLCHMVEVKQRFQDVCDPLAGFFYMDQANINNSYFHCKWMSAPGGFCSGLMWRALARMPGLCTSWNSSSCRPCTQWHTVMMAWLKMLFLTPVGIKTLFPIFENFLCGKELAVKAPNLKRNKPGHLFYVQNV